MRRLFFVAVFLTIAAQLASAQIRLQVTAHEENTQDTKRMALWAKGCDARMADIGQKEKMYMLLTDCGKVTIAVSVEEKVAVKTPPMLSSPAPDIDTAAFFIQGKPQITVEKIEEKPSPSVLGRGTTYYHFKSIHRPDPSIQQLVKITVEKEFWTDATLRVPVLDGMLGKAPFGDAHDIERSAFAAMKGLPLRHRTVVTVENSGSRKVHPAFIQEVISISTEPFDDAILRVPTGFQVVDMANGQQ
jgi:hypothetical protein